MALTENQTSYLKSLLGGPGYIPAIVFAKLRDQGLVEKAEGGPGAGRGKTYANITTEGRGAI